MVSLTEEKIHAVVTGVVLLYVMVSCMVLLAGVTDAAKNIDQVFIQKYVNLTVGLLR